MSSRTACLFCLILLAVFPAARGQPGERPQPFLLWQSESGHQVEAVLLKVDSGQAVLRKKDGQEITIALTDLEEGSRQQALDLSRRSTARAARAAHDEGAYRLRMYRKSIPFTLDVLEQGKGIEYGPFVAEVSLTEKTPDGEKVYRSRGMSGPVEEGAEEAVSLWRGTMQNGMKVEIHIQRAEKHLDLAWRLLSPERWNDTLQARVSLVFPPLDLQSAAAKELQVLAVTADGQQRRLDASSPSDALRGTFQRIEVLLPGTQTRLTFRAAPGGRASLGLHVDDAKSIAEGFRVDTILQDPTRDPPPIFRLEFSEAGPLPAAP